MSPSLWSQSLTANPQKADTGSEATEVSSSEDEQSSSRVAQRQALAVGRPGNPDNAKNPLSTEPPELSSVRYRIVYYYV